MEVILIRHTSVDVPPGVCYGQTDVPLKSTFEQEAAVTQENLKAFLPFDHVYTSPLTRCVRLATYCGYPDAERDKRIMEINFGSWEMKPFARTDDPRLQAQIYAGIIKPEEAFSALTPYGGIVRITL